MQAVAQQATQQSIGSLQQGLQHGAGMQHHPSLQHPGLPAAASMHHGMNDIMTGAASAQVLPAHENNSSTESITQ